MISEPDLNYFEPPRLRFPRLMQDRKSGAIILANAYGAGMVLDRGKSRLLHVGDIIPYVQRFFAIEELDFRPMPMAAEFKIQNLDI